MLVASFSNNDGNMGPTDPFVSPKKPGNANERRRTNICGTWWPISISWPGAKPLMKSCFQKLSTTCFTFFDFPKTVCSVGICWHVKSCGGPEMREGRSQTSRIGAASREVGSDRQNIFDLMSFHWYWCFLYFQSLLWISGWFVFLSPLHLETSPLVFHPGRYTGSAKSGSFQLFKLGNFTIGRCNSRGKKKSWKKITSPKKTNQTHPKNF